MSHTNRPASYRSNSRVAVAATATGLLGVALLALLVPVLERQVIAVLISAPAVLALFGYFTLIYLAIKSQYSNSVQVLLRTNIRIFWWSLGAWLAIGACWFAVEGHDFDLPGFVALNAIATTPVLCLLGSLAAMFHSLSQRMKERLLLALFALAVAGPLLHISLNTYDTYFGVGDHHFGDVLEEKPLNVRLFRALNDLTMEMSIALTPLVLGLIVFLGFRHRRVMSATVRTKLVVGTSMLLLIACVSFLGYLFTGYRNV